MKFCSLFLDLILTLSMSEILKLEWESRFVSIRNFDPDFISIRNFCFKISLLVARPSLLPRKKYSSQKSCYKYSVMKLSYGNSSKYHGRISSNNIPFFITRRIDEHIAENDSSLRLHWSHRSKSHRIQNLPIITRMVFHSIIFNILLDAY